MDTTDETGEMARAMDSFADNIQNVVIGTMNQISEGDVSATVDIRDDQDEIAPASSSLKPFELSLTKPTCFQLRQWRDNFNTRGNATAFKGSYKEIVEGVNKTLNAVVGPFNVAADYVDRIGKGVIPPKITDSYNGDFNNFKE